MSEIDDLQRRITAALDRVSRAVEQLGSGDSDMSDALEAERTANAQLEERVRAIKDKQETTVARLEDEVARLKDAVSRREGEVQSLTALNDSLRQSNAALREASEGAVDGALREELAQLRAEREREAAEMDDILAALAPVLTEGRTHA